MSEPQNPVATFYRVTVAKVTVQPTERGYGPNEQLEVVYQQHVDSVDMHKVVRAVNPDTVPLGIKLSGGIGTADAEPEP